MTYEQRRWAELNRIMRKVTPTPTEMLRAWRIIRIMRYDPDYSDYVRWLRRRMPDPSEKGEDLPMVALVKKARAAARRGCLKVIIDHYHGSLRYVNVSSSSADLFVVKIVHNMTPEEEREEEENHIEW